jgi:hypothetical protein
MHVTPNGRRIRTRVVRRAKPDLERLARLFVEMALDEQRRKQVDSDQPSAKI